MRTVLAVVLLALLLTPSNLAAQCDSAGIWWRSSRWAARLNLTDEQSKRLEARYQSSRTELIALQKTLAEQQRALDGLMRAETIDRSRVDRAIDSVERARAALSKARARLVIDMREMLDESQRRTLLQLTEQRCGSPRSSVPEDGSPRRPAARRQQ